jgi:hypothetical protein
VFLGIPALDQEIRGVSPSHLALLVGYSHSGKSQTTNHIVRHNATKRILWCSPDEPAVLVLTKLASAVHGVPAAELEARVRGDDPSGMRILNETIDQFPGLVVIDRSVTPRVLNAVYDEACDHWGSDPDLVIFDYLDLLQGCDGSVAKADTLKAFTMEHNVPMLLLHQTSRSAGAQGQKMTISSGNYGGETVATYVLGVRRKKAAIVAELTELEQRSTKTSYTLDRIALLHRELAIHQYTLTLNLSKNKRPGGQPVDDIDMELWLDTGVLTPMRPGDLPAQYRRGHLRVVPTEVPW